MKIKKIKDNMYGAKIYLVYNCSLNEFDKLLLKKHNLTTDSSGSGVGGMMVDIGDDLGKIYYVWVEKFDWYINEQGLLVHEVFHLIFQILSDRGLSYSRAGEEAYTYYIQHIYSGMLRALDNEHFRYKKKSKKK